MEERKQLYLGTYYNMESVSSKSIGRGVKLTKEEKERRKKREVRSGMHSETVVVDLSF
jgi:hypothetical protein